MIQTSTADPPATAFQLSLDLRSVEDALAMAELGVEAGVDVLEAGTILILSEGAKRALPALKQRFPDRPLVADIKCMDGGTGEPGLMFDLGATSATVMAAASDATILFAVREAERHPGCQVMVDTMGFGGPDGSDIAGQVAAARRARDLGAHYLVLHLGYDERTADPRMVQRDLLLSWTEAVVAADLGVPIQVVGGLTLAQAAELPRLGIRDVVISMNLGSGPSPDTAYDQLTGFTVDLRDPEDRRRVSARVREFIGGVAGRN